VRRIVVVLLLCVTLAGCAIELVPGSPVPASTPPTGGGPDQAVPTGNTINAAPGPDDPETRAEDERTAVSITAEFWDRWFADQGVRYDPPTVAGGYVGDNGPACAGEPSVPGNAYYCPAGNFLAWDEDLMQAGYAEIGDAWVYLVIAHEWAHAVQAQLPDRFVSQRRSSQVTQTRSRRPCRPSPTTTRGPTRAAMATPASAPRRSSRA
jgi:predicted metalloprotease